MCLRSSIVGLLCSVIIPAAIAEWGTFTQRLDHFSDLGATFQQVVWSKSFVQEGAQPQYIFLYVGGEGPLSLPEGIKFLDYCQQFEALCFALEHRFYGRSVPDGMYPQNMEYLSSDQALEDIAEFIRAQPYPDAKWVTFGGSYAGTLAAWARQGYPDLVHAAISSSAPLLAQFGPPHFDEMTNDKSRCVKDGYSATLGLTSFSTRQLSDPGIRGYAQDLCWYKQACHEFGWLDLYATYKFKTYCNADYTTLMNGIQYINSKHHGTNFTTERVFFVYGSCDPWTRSGKTESNNPNIPVFIIKGGDHCYDMVRAAPKYIGHPAYNDIIRAQLLTVNYLSRWLQEPKDAVMK